MATSRVLNALSDRRLLDPSDDSFGNKVVCLPVDLSLPTLGLDQRTLYDIRARATLFIHSAWAVNFTVGVRSFESQHIEGLHNLLSLSLASYLPCPPQLFFCSSISAVTGATSGSNFPSYIPELYVDEFGYAQQTGYGRSKLVAEHVVRAAARRGANARVLRIGQIVGDTRHGFWNDTEAVPLMIRSALTVGALPDLANQPGVSWLPVDILARAILELSGLLRSPVGSSPTEHLCRSLSSANPDLVYNILNPTRLSWAHDILPGLRSAGLVFDVLPTQEWLRRLRDSEQDPLVNPPVKLRQFWEKKYAINRSGNGEENGYQRFGEGRSDSSDLSFEMKTLMDDSVIMREGNVNVEMDKFVAQWLKTWT